MTAWSCRLVRPAAALFVAAWGFAGGGCVSAKYKLARESADAPPPAALELRTATPTAAATLHTVIVFHGPGSWKRDAYWDEYVVTLSASDESLTLDQVALIDQDGRVTLAGRDPWELDEASRAALKVAKHTGRQIVLGAGVGAAWLGSLALFASNMTVCGVASTTSAAVGATGIVALPAIALGSGVRTLVARHGITKEFNRRRIALPARIPGGSSRTGSFFFPVTPAPAQLRLRGRNGAGAPQELLLELAPLAQLHLHPGASPQSPGQATSPPRQP